MHARTHFFGRYGHVVVAIVIGGIALVDFSQGEVLLPLLCAGLLVAVALSVHATERMMFLESNEAWHEAERREAELHQEVAHLTSRISEV